MSTYTPPTTEQKFLLRHIVGMEDLAGHNAFAEASADVVEAIVDGAGALAAGEFAPLNRTGDEVGAKWSPEGVTMPPGFRQAYQAYVEGGWGTLAGPPDFGGQGLPLTLATVLMEDLGSANMALSLCMMLSPGAVEALVHHGTAELQAAWLPKLVTGEWNGTMNLTESQAGSDVGALKTRAEPAEDGSWRITGQKIFITYGEHDLTDNIVHLVLARTPGAPQGTKGISLFLVPKIMADGSRNDVRCVSIEHKLGIHASPTCVMAYGDEGGATGWLIGEENKGMAAMFTMMNNARLNVALQGVGIAEAASQRAVAYALERRQGGKAIAEHPDVRRMLLRMRSLTMGARSLTYYAFGQADRGARGDEAAALRAEVLTPLTKAWATDVGCEVASLGVQVHGGMGFIEETGAAQHLRDARIAPIYEGTNGIQAADLVSRKLGLDGGAAFDLLIGDIRAEALDPRLVALADVVEVAAASLRQAPPDDRLAGSYPFLTMCSALVAGWLLERQAHVVGASDFHAAKRAAAGYFKGVVVPEALGLAAGVEAGAAMLFAVPSETLG
jgi:alkylation response protein AidB-like acyl-CoA dehydrogenase